MIGNTLKHLNKKTVNICINAQLVFINPFTVRLQNQVDFRALRGHATSMLWACGPSVHFDVYKQITSDCQTLREIYMAALYQNQRSFQLARLDCNGWIAMDRR